ncbi:MAG TPA: MFS transporter [Streptosporangiaceae bacterium]|nr:MFS transporter [Streptosporangiaceae bacterium]
MRLPGAAGRWASGTSGLLSLGQLASTVGDYCYSVALPWLILSNHGSTVLLGTVLACYGVPRTVLIPVGGILADRISPRTVMLAADATRCLLVAALVALAVPKLIALAFLGPVAALLGAGEGLFLPAAGAIMPSLLPADSLQAGNGISQAMVQVGSIVGPVLGGILVTTWGSAPAFAVDAASFAASAIALVMMRRHRLPGPSDQPAEAADTIPDDPPATGEATTFWQLALHARFLQIVLVVAVLANFAVASTMAIALPALAHARFGATGYGTLIACFGVGSLIGTLVAIKLSGIRRPAPAACASLLVTAVALSFIPFLGGLPGAAAAAFAFGAGAIFGNIVIITLLQQWAPPSMIGRVMSTVMLASIGTYPASVALAGVIVRAVGPAPFFPVSGGVLALAVLFALSQRQFRVFGSGSGD